MRLDVFVISTALALAPSMTAAEPASDPMFGNDPHAKAVLDCHAGYAHRFAAALTSTRATPTEIATAAYAHCIGQLNDFAQAVAVSAWASKDPGVFLDPRKYQDEQVARMREHSFAYTLDTYLKLSSAL